MYAVIFRKDNFLEWKYHIGSDQAVLDYSAISLEGFMVFLCSKRALKMSEEDSFPVMNRTLVLIYFLCMELLPTTDIHLSYSVILEYPSTCYLHASFKHQAFLSKLRATFFFSFSSSIGALKFNTLFHADSLRVTDWFLKITANRFKIRIRP